MQKTLPWRALKIVLLIACCLAAIYISLGVFLYFKPEVLAQLIEQEEPEHAPLFLPDRQSPDWPEWFRQQQDAGWQVADAPLTTRWGEAIDPGNVLPEYPRPQLQRDRWLNLNGLWSFNVVPRETERVSEFPGQILVPFALEAPLSGVGRPLYAGERLWYQRQFELPPDWQADERIMLHFGAVDYHARVFVNGSVVGEHRGGYGSFSFDITEALLPGAANELVVAVADPTNADGATQQRGKQHLAPAMVFYTATSGIWQTVWLEPLASGWVSGLAIDSNIDTGSAAIRVDVSGAQEGLVVEVTLKGEGTSFSGVPGQPITVTPQEKQLWSPDNPHLYPVTVTLRDQDAVLDTVNSYFALRTVGRTRTHTHDKGQSVFTLNGEPIFHYGALDQGYWPDGIMTAPADAALVYDLELLKATGMNTVRKHIKVEPARFYYHADRLGLMVWQDMPNGGKRLFPPESVVQILRFILPFGVAESKTRYVDDNYASWGRDADSRAGYEAELGEMIDQLAFFPSVVMWVPFNENWGQFDAARIADQVKQRDATRLVNHASGWVDQDAGDVFDQHLYTGYDRFCNFGDPRGDRVGVLGEFGGKTLAVSGHQWTMEVFGYGPVDSREALLDDYTSLLQQHVIPGVEHGLGAAIYTQVSDIEREINGLVTYDRKVEKFDRERLRQLHQALYGAFRARHAGRYGSGDSPPSLLRKTMFRNRDLRQANCEPSVSRGRLPASARLR